MNDPMACVVTLTVAREVCGLATTWLARRGRGGDELVVVVLADHAYQADQDTKAPAARMRGRLGGRREVRG